MNVYLSDYVNLMNPQSNMKIHKERNYYAMCAPEIYMNDAPFSTQTDVFSLGMVGFLPITLPRLLNTACVRYFGISCSDVSHAAMRNPMQSTRRSSSDSKL